ncbi:hypothetical protein BD289DRAFT_213308 [Coniella lustricola]|uniref:Uncharacterized protein n=1 Tax=Coniella lustricola TaxID=2025994 RepID=A0A2T3ABN6_9PEZI|nr:hypothetical protein BD289DRAFT_213308 [Coniella lustricola]
MKELLDSDRVNYLVWRYLLESNYRESAAKLQKEWRIQAPHRHFDFAPHVQNYALVNLLNKGLVYNSLERDYEQSQVRFPRSVCGSALLCATQLSSAHPSLVATHPHPHCIDRLCCATRSVLPFSPTPRLWPRLAWLS